MKDSFRVPDTIDSEISAYFHDTAGTGVGHSVSIEFQGGCKN